MFCRTVDPILELFSVFKENLNYLTAVLSNITNTNNSPLLKFAYVLPDHIVFDKNDWIYV